MTWMTQYMQRKSLNVTHSEQFKGPIEHQNATI